MELRSIGKKGQIGNLQGLVFSLVIIGVLLGAGFWIRAFGFLFLARNVRQIFTGPI